MDPADFTTVVFVAFMVAAAVWDVTRRRIPNKLVLAGIAAALILRALDGRGALWGGLTGAGLAFAVTFPLFALRGLGGGDVKLFAAVGAFTGFSGFVFALLASAIVGGFIALALAIRRGVIFSVLLDVKELVLNAVTLGRVGERNTLDTPHALKIPYGAAIAIGSIAVWFLQLGRMPW